MENKQLFQTIEQLKETLSDVASAREQVSETVMAYRHIQTEIHSYIGNLNEIESAISSLVTLLQTNKAVVDQEASNAVSNLKASCDTILNQTKNELAVISQRFCDDTGRNLSTLSNQIECFDHSIDKANALTNKVEETSKEVVSLIGSVKALQEDLISTQKSQDEAIGYISAKQDEVKATLLRQDEVLSQNGLAIESVGESISKNSISITESLSVLSSILTESSATINNAVEELKMSLESESAKISKGINFNRWLIIVVFVMLAILQFLFKYK